MLNRRNLRVKAIQAVFSYRKKVDSNHSMALDLINERFAPDLNSMERPDYQKLEANKREAAELFEKYLKKENTKASNDEIKTVLSDCVATYNARNQEDFKKVRVQMIADTQQILTQYYEALSFLVELSNMGLKTHKTAIDDNKVLRKFADDDDFNIEINRRNIKWDKEDSMMKKFFQNSLRNTEEYTKYNLSEKHSFEEDRDFVLWLAADTVLDNPLIQAHFEDQDLYWNENKKIIKSLLKKTIKHITAEHIEYFSLSENWDDDKEFMVMLYNSTCLLDDELRDNVNRKLENWDSERVAGLDRIVIEMAIQEMILFPSIPVKVTINEFIDISKVYCSPKSKIFINGLLDKISKEYLDNGKIQKSGRGLIDNK